MTLQSSGAISLNNVNTELGRSATGSINMNESTVRTLAGAGSSGSVISMNYFYGKSYNVALTGTQSTAACYSAQAGFSVDRVGGVLTLSMGNWPSDPPNCQTCSWQWLQFKGIGSTTAFNSYRVSTNTRPYWTMTWNYNLDTIAVGSTITTQCPFWPYTLVAYTYQVYRSATNQIRIRPYPNYWGTGDNGTTVSVINWWYRVVSLGGGSWDGYGNITVQPNIYLTW